MDGLSGVLEVIRKLEGVDYVPPILKSPDDCRVPFIDVGVGARRWIRRTSKARARSERRRLLQCQPLSTSCCSAKERDPRKRRLGERQRFFDTGSRGWWSLWQR